MDPQPSQSVRRILVVSASVGAGHNQAARAVVEALRLRVPGASVEMIDSLTFTPRFFRAYYAGGFNLMMSRLGWLYGLGFWLFNRPHRPGRSLGERLRLAWERLCTRKLARRLLADPPDLIVHTHFLAPPVIGRLLAKGLLRCPQAMVLTDQVAHRWWYSQCVEHWFVPSRQAAQTLGRWGVEDSRVTVSGIPIMQKWTQPVDRAKALADWKLPADKKLVVLSAGAEFTAGPVVRIVRGLLAACPRACVAVLAGRNKKLLARLASLPEAGSRLFPMAFTDRNNELVAACSLIVAKPGGITTAECLATGTPMVLLKPVPGQERCNAIYLRRQGAALVARNARDAIEIVKRLLDDDRALTELSAKARGLYLPATRIICDRLAEVLYM